MTTPYEPLLEGEQLFLRGCNKDGTSRGGFQWPLEVGAEAVAPDWSPEPVCGQGLHGNLNGGGDSNPLVSGGVGLVVAARSAIDLDGKHKFEKCRVLFVGKTLQNAATWLAGHPALPRGAAVHYATATAGHRGTATVGHQGTATAGDCGTATAGRQGTATAGFRGTATAGHAGTATAGDQGTATAGDYGTATAGDQGTATAGYHGIAKAGDRGTATAGYHGTAKAGYQGTATAGMGGVLVIRNPDGRLRCAEVDGKKIKANVAYRLGADGEFEVAK